MPDGVWCGVCTTVCRLGSVYADSHTSAAYVVDQASESARVCVHCRTTVDGNNYFSVRLSETRSALTSSTLPYSIFRESGRVLERARLSLSLYNFRTHTCSARECGSRTISQSREPRSDKNTRTHTTERPPFSISVCVRRVYGHSVYNVCIGKERCHTTHIEDIECFTVSRLAWAIVWFGVYRCLCCAPISHSLQFHCLASFGLGFCRKSLARARSQAYMHTRGKARQRPTRNGDKNPHTNKPK